MKSAMLVTALLLASPLALAQETQPLNPAPAAPAPAAEPAAAPAALAPDVTKAVQCATLSQQFGDTLTALTAPTAKTPLDENVKKTSSEQAGAGRTACMAKDYEAGMEQLRQALATLGKKPVL